jgi:hypothetical protein
MIRPAIVAARVPITFYNPFRSKIFGRGVRSSERDERKHDLEEKRQNYQGSQADWTNFTGAHSFHSQFASIYSIGYYDPWPFNAMGIDEGNNGGIPGRRIEVVFCVGFIS